MDKGRLREWDFFSYMVYHHIKEYAIPQYGDKPGDNLSTWNAADCVRQIGKYVKRFSTNARGANESKNDLLKVAHYACVAYIKLSEEVDEQEIRDAEKSN